MQYLRIVLSRVGEAEYLCTRLKEQVTVRSPEGHLCLV